jgi:MarR family transcriptional regulator, organic hydroperoxide resistance regulator
MSSSQRSAVPADVPRASTVTSSRCPSTTCWGLLGEHSELPVGEVALAAGVAAPTATRMLDHLQRAGIVRRAHSTRDRRVVTVALTTQGHQLLARKRAQVAEKRRTLHDSLTPSEREQAERLLRRLAGLIEEL